MYDKFVLRNLEEGIIRGYSWHLEDPEKVICIVHGIGEYGGRFDRVAEAFRDKNMAVCALDLRGHGESLGKRGDCAPRNSVLDDVSELLRYAEEKYPGKPLVLYGHSMGGNIVLDYRARGEMNDHPAGYIISAPWVRLVRPVPPLLYKAVKLLSRMVHNRISALCAVDGFDKGIGFEDGTAEDDRRAAKIPTLLMHGSEDRICDVNGSRRIAKRLQAQGDDLEYIEWEGLFHEIHNGNETSTGDEVIAKMVRWAQEL